MIMKYVLFSLGIILLFAFVVKHIGRRNKTNKNDENADPDDDGKTQMDENKLKACLELNNTWIGNSDEKASILLAMIGVVFTIFVTSDAIKVIRSYIALPFKQYWSGANEMVFNFSRFSVFIYLVITAIFSCLSLLNLLNTIRPNIDYDSFCDKNPSMAKKSYLFYGHVANMSYEKYKTDSFDYVNDLRSQVYVNSYIANEKFKNYIEALFWFKMSLLAASMLFISLVFMQ